MKLSCKDVDPTSDCDFEAKGNSEGEVIAKMMAHVKKDHMDKVEDMSDASLVDMMESKVHD